MQLRLKAIVTLICWFGATGSAFSQDGGLQLGQLNKLAGHAIEAVDVTFGEDMLQAMATTRSGEASNPAKFKATLSRLKSVTVKGFKFEKPGDYAAADVDAVRAQLAAPGWKRIVAVNHKRGRDNGELYLRFEGESIIGLALIAAAPSELYVVNVMGAIEIDEISIREGLRGLSRLDPSWSDWTGKRN